ncbi:MAG: cell wall hydrolase [Lachnospiraceae bacterium]|nr:cell wall hydrolase [Lachnospiraceae bacterium]
MRKIYKHKIATLLIFVLLAASMPVVSYATSTQDKLNAAEDEKERLEQEQKEAKEELKELQKEQKGLKAELAELNQQLADVGEHLEDLEYQIGEKELEIEYIVTALAEAKETEAWQYESMKVRMQYMYEMGDTLYLESLFHIDSFSDLLNFNDYFEQLTSYDQSMLDEFIANREHIESIEVQLNQDMAVLDGLKLEAEAEKSKVSGLIGQLTTTIQQYAEDIEEAEAEAEAYEKQIKEKEKDIEYLKKKIQEEILLSQAAANATWRDISQVKFAEGDRYLLANLIYCEAGGEPYVGQVAVGAVVMNRVLSSKYPDTVVGVIYQKSQFSPAGSGRLALALAHNKATASCYKAADEAMAGVTNVGNCLYFRTPIPGLTGIRIGGHIFY